MLTNIILNTIFAFMTISLSSGIALHDSRLDKVFANMVAPANDTTQHDLDHAVSHELHVHDASQLTSATNSDPGVKARTHRKHTALAHTRFKLASLTA